MRILVVDDDDLVRDLFRTILSGAGYEVATARNGAEALTALDSRPADLVLTDILMPEKEGVETILEIRQKHPGVGIIAISGGGPIKNLLPLEIAGKAGADLILSKPIERENLLAAVRRVAEKIRPPGPDHAAHAKP